MRSHQRSEKAESGTRPEPTPPLADSYQLIYRLAEHLRILTPTTITHPQLSLPIDRTLMSGHRRSCPHYTMVFPVCVLHPKSEVPCEPTAGWSPNETRDCARHFVKFPEFQEKAKSACLDITLARILECILEERPNQALQELNNGIAKFITKWPEDDNARLDVKVSNVSIHEYLS